MKQPVKSCHLAPAHVFVERQSTLVSTVVGSNVAVCLWDRELKIGGMNNFQFPNSKQTGKISVIYGNVATLLLVKMMIGEGAQTGNIEAQLFGGGIPPWNQNSKIGTENIKIARSVLRRKGIRIVSEDVGGSRGRKIVFDTHSGQVAVLKVQRIRQDDWLEVEKLESD